MESIAVPPKLREQLGESGVQELLELIHAFGRLWSEQMLTVDRFERRLAEELGKIRIEMASARVELLTWSFLFWVGQVAAMAGLLALMLGRASH